MKNSKSNSNGNIFLSVAYRRENDEGVAVGINDEEHLGPKATVKSRNMLGSPNWNTFGQSCQQVEHSSSAPLNRLKPQATAWIHCKDHAIMFIRVHLESDQSLPIYTL